LESIGFKVGKERKARCNAMYNILNSKGKIPLKRIGVIDIVAAIS
jgi:hypothetical protein